ncbi:DMT family transporter [Alkalimonas collagenimarina]|uniref:DMT family transporter n=1 Tax=Alkalimonas collagenimarina TaxID=400390 RepID=A0ABT9H3I4_9GAMM|nr:DMT family transporter [Alkalimonas collagenimarina]MDP4537624.1 DMT family transporter [Alkalimonas collagenimarina]
MHQASGRTLLGFSLALTTAVLWGILPLALKILLELMTASTLTAIRFLVAAVMVGGWLWWRKQLPNLRLLSRQGMLLLLIAIIGLLANYLMYMSGLAYLTAETGQLLIQLAPFLMMIGGVWLFKERLLFWQKVGAFILVSGLLLFFNDRLVSLLLEVSDESLGVLLIIGAGITWAAYALAQKQLLVHYSSKQIMYVIYVAGMIAFIPVSDFSPLFHLSGWHWLFLLFCCLNTVIAYGAFAEALHHWEASKVSAVLAITPLVTIVLANLLAWFNPDWLTPEPLNLLAWLGALMVVAGSMTTALSPLWVSYTAKRRSAKLRRFE